MTFPINIKFYWKDYTDTWALSIPRYKLGYPRVWISICGKGAQKRKIDTVDITHLELHTVVAFNLARKRDHWCLLPKLSQRCQAMHTAVIRQ